LEEIRRSDNTRKSLVRAWAEIPVDTLQGIRNLALMSVFFLTGCRVSAVTGACVGHVETDGIDQYLHRTEERNRKRRKILLDAARPVFASRARLTRSPIRRWHVMLCPCFDA
jgi:integrase